MSNNLKSVCKKISVTYCSLENVLKAFETIKASIPKNATNICTSFEATQEDFSDSYYPCLEVTYHVPKTEADYQAERKEELKRLEWKRKQLAALKRELGE